jgi:TolA-binding protein
MFNNKDLNVSGVISNKVFIFDGVNVTITNDGTSTLVNSQIMTGNDATVTFNGLVIENSYDAIVFESAGNVLNNSIITINSEDEVHAITLYDDNNIITNTIINVTAPSGDVQYNPDWSTKAPAPTAILISANNTLLDNVTVYFDAPTSVGYFPTVNGIHIGSVDGTITNTTLRDTKVNVKGTNYAYGINVGNAKDTTLENVDVTVESAYYADAIQLFDGDHVTISGTAKATAESEAYGVYSTAMGTGYSKNIDLTGLDMTVEAQKATGILIEGSQNVLIADADYEITGNDATAINAHVDWMGNIPTNITITELNININTDGDANVLYFGNASDITITDNHIETTGGNKINFNVTPNAKVTDNYIVIKDITTGYFGDYTVMTTEDDTIIENNTPTIPIVDELQEQIDNLTQTVDDQQQQIDDLQQQLEELQQQLAQLTAPKATTITFDPINATYNTPLTITGELTDNKDNLLNNKEITITVNGKTYTTKTKNGAFNITTSRIISMDEQTLTATFAGDEDYNSTETTTTFTMNKQDTEFTLDEIKDVKYLDIINITGTYKNAVGQAIINSNIQITINGQTSKVKTDDKGRFSIEYKATNVGENNITISYPGSKKFNGAELTTTFTVDKQDTVLTLNDVSSVQYSDNVTITGTFKTADGQALINSNVVLYINGEHHTVKTDNNGVFTYTFKATNIGENTITATYEGNTRYNAAENVTTTLTVDKKDTIITINPMSAVKKGDSVTVKGTFKDSTGAALIKSTVIVYINGEHHTIKTDNKGVYNYTFTAKKIGENEIKVVYNGNTKYNAYETKTTLTVNE